MDEAITFQAREGGHLPAFLRGGHHVTVRHQHVGLQAGVRASDSEQVAILSYDFMLDKAGFENCWKD